LVVPLPLERAVRDLCIVNILKVFRERLVRLLAEFVTATDEFHTVALVEAHIEPLGYVTGWELFGDA
jgi:hypothetical protein